MLRLLGRILLISQCSMFFFFFFLQAEDGIRDKLVTVVQTCALPISNPNAFGWYKGDVTIHWTGQDLLSGVDPATQPADNTISGEGSNLGTGPASISDKAGNSASASVSGV